MILQINKFYKPDIGGVETVVKNYADFLKAYDSIIILCVNKRFSLKTTIEYIDGVKVYRCASLGTYLSMPISITFYYHMFFLSRQASYIHIHEPFPLASLGYFLLPSKVKLFITWHSDIVKQKIIKNFVHFFQKKLCTKATNIIVCSNNLISFSPILNVFKNKIVIIPLSLDEKCYRRNINCTNIVSELPNEYVLFLGRFAYYKGILQLLEAIELIDKKIPFVIVGDGPLSAKIIEKIQMSDKNIYLINRFVTDEEKKCLLMHCKFMVFPSIYPSEAFGIIQLEAMAYAKPIINTNLPTGVPWVSLDNVSGLTVEPFDIQALAEKIVILYLDTDLQKRLSAGAFNRFKKYFIDEKNNKLLYKLYFKNF